MKQCHRSGFVAAAADLISRACRRKIVVAAAADPVQRVLRVLRRVPVITAPASAGPAQRFARVVAGAALLAGAPSIAWAESVNRCEGADRSVVYSNEGCPAGTRLIRSFDPTPPVIVNDGKAGRPAQEAGEVSGKDRDVKPAGGKAAEGKPGDGKSNEGKSTEGRKRTPVAADGKPAEPKDRAAPERGAKDQGAPDGAAAAPSRPGRVERTPAAPRALTPDEAREAAADKRKQKVSDCDDLVRQIEFAQRDFAAASPNEKASTELALRRLQQQYQETCRRK
jgi:hypothetical protein